KWNPTRKHFIKQNAKGPDIGSHIRDPAFELFGRKVFESPDYPPGHSHIRGSFRFSYTEVQQLYRAGRIYFDVIRFDVAVDNHMTVDIVNGPNDRLKYR